MLPSMTSSIAEIAFSSELLNNDSTLVDVRSASEFNKGHIPGAINIPLFDDEQRAEVGTIYKQQSKEEALQRGLEIALPQVEQYLHAFRQLPGKEIIIYCWRGGMRSGEMCRLVNGAGLPAKRIIGGYKSYRHCGRVLLEQPRQLLVIGGKTGSGKTALLLALQNMGMQVIDLEGLAHHKGSVFGHINEQPQPSTEQFENNLHQQLQAMDPTQPLLVENESHIIGSVHVPQTLLQQMRGAPLLLIEVPLAARIKRLVADYRTSDRELLISAARRIEKKLTKAKLNQVIELLEADNFSGACEILLGYYDRYYNRGLDKRQNQSIYHLELAGFELQQDSQRLAQKIEALCSA